MFSSMEKRVVGRNKTHSTLEPYSEVRECCPGGHGVVPQEFERPSDLWR